MAGKNQDELPSYPWSCERDGVKLVTGQVPALHFPDLREWHDSATGLEVEPPEWAQGPRRTKLK